MDKANQDFIRDCYDVMVRPGHSSGRHYKENIEGIHPKGIKKPEPGEIGTIRHTR